MYFNKFTIETDYSKSEIVEKLKTITYTDKIPWFRYINTEKLFYGKINGEKFSITQVIKGRNSFTPIITGQVISGDRNLIVLKMRLPFIVLIVIAWFTFLITWAQLKNLDFGVVIFLVFLYGMTLYFYIDECNKVKKIFEDEFLNNT